MHKYSCEKNTQILISLLKQHGVKRIIISPGAQNICFVGSVQNDEYFELYSAPDERSAAYMACGMAESDGKPVALSCTGATASRNYIPGLTEAYYRHLPIIAITSTKHTAFVGQNIPQVIDRSVLQNDIVRRSVYVPTIENSDDSWGAVVDINTAILELTHRGGGPTHINLETTHNSDYSLTELPVARAIFRINNHDDKPIIPTGKKIAVIVGSHCIWDSTLTHAVDLFCKKYNAVVICDHTSNYHGEFKVLPALVSSQSNYRSDCIDIDLAIDIGNISGAYYNIVPKVVWRVDPDGEIKDTYRKLKYVFEMTEYNFFTSYNDMRDEELYPEYYNKWINEYNSIHQRIPELPFSNLWVAGKLSAALPEKSILHLAILNSLRSWNYYYISDTIDCFSNTGGFGIDGPVSTALGNALSLKNRMHFLIVGDLAFFYDLNALGNRHFPTNLRILLINNGIGTEFKNYNHKAAVFGDDADYYMAAGGHYGNKSRDLVKHYAQDLGLKYLFADNKASVLENMPLFLSKNSDRSIVFEIFTDSDSESNAYKTIREIKTSFSGFGKKMAKSLLSDESIRTVKGIMRGK